MGKKENCIVLVTHSAGDSLFPAATVSTEGHIQPSPAHDTHWVKKTQQKRKTKPSLVWNEEKGDLLSALPLCDSREGQLLPISARPCWNFRFCIGKFSWQISDSDWAWISSNKTCSQHTPGMGFSESDRKHNMGCCCLFRIYFDFKCKKILRGLFNTGIKFHFSPHNSSLYEKQPRRLQAPLILKTSQKWESTEWHKWGKRLLSQGVSSWTILYLPNTAVTSHEMSWTSHIVLCVRNSCRYFSKRSTLNQWSVSRKRKR